MKVVKLVNTKPLLDVLAGRKITPPPIWLMRQAGRYLPEYKAIRSKASGFLDLCYDAELACEITLQPIKRFSLDAAIIFSDILVIPHALGQEVKFLENIGPSLSRIEDMVGLGQLNESRIINHLAPVYEAITKVRNSLPPQVALIGFAGAPWTVSTYMIEGGSSRDFVRARRFAYEDPRKFSELIDLLVNAISVHLCCQISAGAEAVQIFDTWAGALSADGFRRWVVEPTTAIVDRIREKHGRIPIIGFPRGAGPGYLEYVEKTGVDAIGIDSSISPIWAAEFLQSKVAIQGNLDPILLLTGGKPMHEEIQNILGKLNAGPFIFNLGHGVIKETPPEHVEQLIKQIELGLPESVE